MQNLFDFKDLGNGKVLVTTKKYYGKYELDKDLLDQVMAKKEDLKKLALKLYRADKEAIKYSNTFSFRVYYQPIFIEMKKVIGEAVWSKEDVNILLFIFGPTEDAKDAGKVTAPYYIALMAMEYLGILDEFFESHSDFINKIYDYQASYRDEKNKKRRDYYKKVKADWDTEEEAYRNSLNESLVQKFLKETTNG